MPKERDFSVDIIKVIAVLLIINSHADICFPKYSFFATGGAIGDCLFLFCSGYTIFLGSLKRFDNFYKRRISRIFPSCFASIVTMLLLQGSFDNLLKIITLCTARDFLVAIMVYYILLYIIRCFFIKKIQYMFVVVVIVTCIAYYFFPYKNEIGVRGLYGITTVFRWIPYFGVCLMGAYLGIHRENLKFNLNKDFPCFVISVILFYGIQIAAKVYPALAPIQIVSVVFLSAAVFYLYKVCNADFLKKLYYQKIFNSLIMVLGGLCLESYLIQYSVITDKLNWMFPFNIPIIYGSVFLLAYVVRCLARIFSQIFRTEDFDWKKVFSFV